MAGEEEVTAGPIFVQRGLVGRARLQVVGANEFHVVVLVPVVLSCGEADSAYDQQAEHQGHRENAEDQALHRSLLLFKRTFSSVGRRKGANRTGPAWRRRILLPGVMPRVGTHN